MGENNKATNYEVVSLCVDIMHALISKGASKPVLDSTFFDLGGKSFEYLTNPAEANKNRILPYLRSMHDNIREASEEQVQNLDIFLPGYKKPEQSHLIDEEGEPRNVDECSINYAVKPPKTDMSYDLRRVCRDNKLLIEVQKPVKLLADFDLVEGTHLSFEEGGLRNVDNYRIRKKA